MTDQSTPRPPRRSNADYRWTRQKAIAFLHALRACGSVAGAARSVGMSRQSAYRLRARYGEGYASVWDEGVELARRHGLRRIVSPSQGDGRPVQGDSRVAQGDAFVPQDDGRAAQGDAFRGTR